MKYSKLFTNIFFILCSTLNGDYGFLLKSPPIITPQELQHRILNSPGMVMNFRAVDSTTNECWQLEFEYIQDVTVLRLQLVGKLPPYLALSEQQKFVHATNNGQDMWTYSYSQHAIKKITLKLPDSIENTMGMMNEPLITTGKKVREMSVAELAKIINTKKFVFYTGAGISAGVVPTMNELLAQLSLDQDLSVPENRISLIKKILKNPEFFLIPMDRFFRACIYGIPTKAHDAITNILQHKPGGLLTENLDLLHQHTGIDPLNHSLDEWLRNNIAPEDLKQIEVVITVGLASDESGFLKWYKTENPQGIIIAINREQPTYLGQEDYLMLGDAQEILPDVMEYIKEVKNIEIELRYEILNKQELQDFLSSLHYQHTKHNIDVYLDTPDVDLLQKGVYIRIRDNKTLDIKFNRACLHDPNLEIQPYCEEYSFALPLKEKDLERLNEITAVIGLTSIEKADLDTYKQTNNLVDSRVIDKVRATYTYDIFTIAHDEVTNLGTFLEIEVMTKDTLQLAEIKYSMESLIAPLTLKPIKTVYDSLMLRKHNFPLYLKSRFILDEDKKFRPER